MRESAQALASFVLYRDMGEHRSVERVRAEYPESTPSAALLKRWCTQYGWVERARQHDESIAAAAAERDKRRRLAEADERRKDRLLVAKAVRAKVVNALNEIPHGDIVARPTLIVPMLEYADKTERLDHGEATDRVGVEDGEMSLGALIAIALRKEEK